MPKLAPLAAKHAAPPEPGRGDARVTEARLARLRARLAEPWRRVERRPADVRGRRLLGAKPRAGEAIR